jgi:hypothetical protein
VINRGKLISSGSLEALLGRKGFRVVVEPLADASRVLGEAGLKNNLLDGALMVEADDGAAISKILAAAGLYPSELVGQSASLESVFLELTSEP